MVKSMYNLFSNVINPFIDYRIRKNIPNWTRNEILNYLKKKVDEIFNTVDKNLFVCLSKDVFQICESLRIENSDLAHEIYMTFYYEFTTRAFSNIDYIDKTQRLKKMLDFTEIYYNIAKLKWDRGDYDNALYYILQADSQYAVHNSTGEGEFVKLLLNSKEYVLWNFVPFIQSDFYNYKSSFDIYVLNGTIFSDIGQKQIKNLLYDFDLVTLLQFINSINRYHNFLFFESNHYKCLRELRVLGELAWLFECYLKYKFSISDLKLDNLITKELFKNNKNYREIFDEFKSISGLSTQNTRSNKYKEEAIEFLINKLKVERDPSRVIAMCIKTTYFIRNYTAHSLDENFFIFKDSKYSKELYMILLSSFMIANSLINSHSLIRFEESNSPYSNKGLE